MGRPKKAQAQEHLKKHISEPTDGGNHDIALTEPYTATVTIKGSSDILFHRWNCEAIETKGRASKNSAAKKSDNVESYVYRMEPGTELGLPGEYLRQSLIHAAKFRQDPRSPRKSAMDLYKAGVVSLTVLAGLGVSKWDYEDKRRVVVQRAGINRVRPAFRIGWKATFEIMVLLPEYIAPHDLNDAIQAAGRLVGVGDFRPTFGRFQVVKFSA